MQGSDGIAMYACCQGQQSQRPTMQLQYLAVMALTLLLLLRYRREISADLCDQLHEVGRCKRPGRAPLHTHGIRAT